MSLLLMFGAAMLGGIAAEVKSARQDEAPVSTAGSPACATSDLAALISDMDYPAEAIRRDEQGTVGFALDVSAEGRVISCRVTSSSGSEILDTETCRVISKRARFTPARDGNGRAVKDVVHSSIRWMLPEAPEGSPFSTVVRGDHNIWEVTAAGKQRSCRRELHFIGGERVHVGECEQLNAEFVRAAAAHLQLRPKEVLTVRLENQWIIEPVIVFPPYEEDRGELLVRGEGDYRLNEDQSVRDCAAGRISARLDWHPEPCFRSNWAGVVPPGTRTVRLAV